MTIIIIIIIISIIIIIIMFISLRHQPRPADLRDELVHDRRQLAQSLV